MPCPKYNCEFCDAEFRRDAIGTHVKAKHEAEIIALIMRDCRDEGMKSTLQKVVNFATGLTPVYSKLYDGGRYYFGVKPMFFPDDEKDDIVIPYLQNEMNIEAHQKYLTELCSKITLKDYIDDLIRLEIIAPNVYKLKKEFNILQKKFNESQEELDIAQRKAKCATENYEELKRAYQMDSGDSIASMKQQIAYLLKHRNNNEREVQNYKHRFETIEEEHEKMIAEINLKHSKEREKQWEAEDNLRKEIETLKKTIEKQKEKEQKAIDKAITKYKADKKKKEKAKKKALKVAMAKADSDSESESDSGSDSD